MFNYKSKNPKVDMKAGFYNRCFFDLRLCEERRRSERSGLPFSVLSVDIMALVDSAKKHARLNALQVKHIVSDIVRENCRLSDIKTWYDETTLKILLPETAMKEAHVLSDKLNKKFSNGLRRSLGRENNYDLKENIVITSFPEVIKPSESLPGEKTRPAGRPKVVSVLRPPKDDDTSTTLTMKWHSMDSMSLTWPLYSDVLNESNLSNAKHCIKRAIDIMGALAGIILFSPMLLVIALLIKITSCGPILFRQSRMGFLGKKFTFLKFRSMYADCSEARHREYVTNLIKKNIEALQQEPECKPLYKMNKDPRITPFGHFLRKSSLDELPQLFNVLKGDMSLVGPRPPIPYEVEKYENWHFRRVLEVKPGITGLWQVEGRSSTTFDEMVRLDIAYVNNFSLWLDLKILFKTIWVVFSGKGAY
jgi:lipopolysaccharide/colanic/teichoic acid biosynthesis glycosyltransferase/GGDEF domain-containing protein